MGASWADKLGAQGHKLGSRQHVRGIQSLRDGHNHAVHGRYLVYSTCFH